MTSSGTDIALETRYGSVAIQRWGNPKGPRVLALHGWLDNLASFHPLAPELSACDLVLVDLFGHGHTARRADPGAYHVVDAVAFVHEVLTVLGWSRATLLGHSLGGAVSMIFSGTFPEMVERLVAIESPGPLVTLEADMPERMARSISQLARIHTKRLPLHPDVESAVTARARAGDLPLEAARLIVARGLRQLDGGYTWRTDPKLMLDSPQRLTEGQVLAFLGRISAPVLHIAADRGLRLPDVDVATRLAAIRRLERRTLGGGHHVHMESPGPVGQMIREFFEATAAAQS